MTVLRAVLFHIKNAALICGITILLLLGIESVSYVLVSLRYVLASYEGLLIDPRSRADGYGNADWAGEYYKEENSRPIYKWHSYTYWRPAPFRGKYTNIDEEGLRQTWNDIVNTGSSETKSSRIFMFGGSTMLGAGARDEETIPSFLAKMLTQEHGFNVKVTNFGTGGYVTTQEVIALLRELQRGNIPDLVIFYDGGNDIFSTFQNRGVGGIPQNESNREREFNLLRPEMIRRLYKETLLATYTNSSTYQVVSSVVRRITGRDLLSLEWDASVYPSPNQVISEVLRVYAWNVTLVKNIGKAQGFKSLFYWQPFIYNKDKPTPYEQQLLEEQKSMAPYYVGATNAVKAQLSNVDEFHDISDVFSGDPKPYFIDSVHITGAGNERVARRMLKDVVPITQELMATRREIRQ
jgi:lysophospholipase L1-like esterase